MNVYLGPLREKVTGPSSRVTTGLHTLAYRIDNHALMQDSLVPDFTSGYSSSKITYTTRRKNSRSKSNLCRHFKEAFTYVGGTSSFYSIATNPTPDWEYYYQNHHRAICDARSSLITKAKTTLGGNFEGGYLGALGQAHINLAFDRLRPNLTTVQIPNFLVDIADLKSLFKLWKLRVGLAKNVAGLHLNYKYGWKPTVGDLKDLIEATLKLRAKLAAFKATIGRVISESTTLEDSSNSVSGTHTDGSFAGTVTYKATVTRKCTGHIVYQSQPLAVMGPMDEVLRGLLDSLGFELNPRIIWDALPFTFVIDYFFGVGSWLDRFSVDALELPILLVDSYLQYKQVLNIEWTWKGTHLSDFNPKPESSGARYTTEWFHRMPLFPDYASLAGLGWKTPTFNQAALLVSLATVLKK